MGIGFRGLLEHGLTGLGNGLALHAGLELLAAHVVMVQQILSDLMELAVVGLEDLLATAVGIGDDHLHLSVDLCGGLLRLGLGPLVVSAYEDLVVVLEGYGTDAVTHAETGDHAPCNGAGALQVTGSTSGNLVYITKQYLDANNEVCGYEYVHLGKMMEAIKNGMDANEAMKKFTGSYGRTTEEQGAVKAIDPRKE